MSGQAASVSAHDDERELLTGEAVALELRATSVILRMAGGIIDYLVYLVATGLLAWGVFSLAIDAGLPEALYAAVGIAVTVVGLVLVPAVVETASQGKSLGRLALGDRIVRDDGGAISFRHAFIRSLVGVFEIVFTGGGLAVVVAMLNSRAKRLGDLLAGTYSQYERVSSVTPPVFGVPVGLVEWASTADVARMPKGSFGSVPTPAIVAPIEFTMRLDDYRALGGHMDRVRRIEEVWASGEHRLIDWIGENPWPLGSPA
jgi:uncharacterized RDD family membrane protein YckC